MCGKASHRAPALGRIGVVRQRGKLDIVFRGGRGLRQHLLRGKDGCSANLFTISSTRPDDREPNYEPPSHSTNRLLSFFLDAVSTFGVYVCKTRCGRSLVNSLPDGTTTAALCRGGEG